MLISSIRWAFIATFRLQPADPPPPRATASTATRSSTRRSPDADGRESTVSPGYHGGAAAVRSSDWTANFGAGARRVHAGFEPHGDDAAADGRDADSTAGGRWAAERVFGFGVEPMGE